MPRIPYISRVSGHFLSAKFVHFWLNLFRKKSQVGRFGTEKIPFSSHFFWFFVSVTGVKNFNFWSGTISENFISNRVSHFFWKKQETKTASCCNFLTKKLTTCGANNVLIIHPVNHKAYWLFCISRRMRDISSHYCSFLPFYEASQAPRYCISGTLRAFRSTAFS